jgi:hypothetical protein
MTVMHFNCSFLQTHNGYDNPPMTKSTNTILKILCAIVHYMVSIKNQHIMGTLMEFCKGQVIELVWQHYAIYSYLNLENVPSTTFK